MNKKQKIEVLELIKKGVLDKQKNGYQSKYEIDEFINKLKKYQFMNIANMDLDFLFYKEYNYQIAEKETILYYFATQQIQMDYEDGYDIKYYMDNIDTAEEYVYIDLRKQQIGNGEKLYKYWLNDLLTQIDDYINEIENENE